MTMVMKRLTREESRQQTRERLLDAGRSAFVRLGFGGASIDVISAEAGYSKGAFYSNFDSKEALFLDLLGRHMATEAVQLQALLDQDDVLVPLGDWLHTLNRDADWALLAMELQLHAHRSPKFAAEYDRLNEEHAGRLGALLSALFARSGKRMPCLPDQLGRALMALAHGMVLQRQPTNGRPDPAGAMIKLVLESLLSASPPS
jgi:AcrR family transcriptional regulator